MNKKVVVYTCLAIVVATLVYITFFKSEPATQSSAPNIEASTPTLQEVSSIPAPSSVGPITEGGLTTILPTPPKTQTTNKPATVTTGSNISASNSPQSSSNTTQQTNTASLPAEQGNNQAGTNPATATQGGSGLLAKIEIDDTLSTPSAILIPNYVGDYNSYTQNPSVAAKIVFRAYDANGARIKNGSISYDADAYNESFSMTGQNYCPNNPTLEATAKNHDECYYMLYYRPGEPGNNALIIHLTSLPTTIAKSVQVTGIQQNLIPPNVQSNAGALTCSQDELHGDYVFDGCLGITATSGTIRYYLRSIDYTIITSSNIAKSDISFNLVSDTGPISLINEGSHLGLTGILYVDSQTNVSLNFGIILAHNRTGTFKIKITGTEWSVSEESTPTVFVPLNITTDVLSTVIAAANE